MVIRRMIFDDLEFFNKLRNSCVGFLHDKTKHSLDQAKQWFLKNKPVYFILLVDNEKVGYFRTSNWTSNSCYIGLDIDECYRGKGYAVPAYREFVALLKQHYNISNIYLEVLSSNTRAIHIYNKLGFEKTSELYYSETENTIKMQLR